MINKCFIVICLFFLFISCNVNRIDLKNNGVITKGIIKKVYHGTKGGINIDYEFNVGDRTIQGSELFLVSSSYEDLFKNKSFPVIYSKKNYGRNRLLIFESNFNDFGLSFPDSLKWTKKLSKY